MPSSYCHELPYILSIVLSFFLFSSVFAVKGYEKSWQENETSMLGDESKKMNLINANLRKINKPFVKSIKSPDGDIIDCVLIHLQPAFDLPRLRGTMPVDPSKLPKEHGNMRTKSKVKQLWSSNGESCPNGTIPIRRTSASDILRSRSISKFGKKISAKNNLSGRGHEHALGYVSGGEYYGVKATLNLWAPNVTHDGFSNSQIWIINHDVNVIEAGWMVYPELYGDNSPRLFTYWTNDGYRKSGCYNLLCSGFVQTNNKISVGAAIAPVSTYGGNQFDISLMITKDPKSGDWWLSMDKNRVGYWPSSLLPSLQQHATMIQFGGEVFNSEASGLTQMGSGHLPTEGYGKASFVNNIELVERGSVVTLASSDITVVSEQPNCYDVTKGYDDNIWGNYIYFGGPGNNPKCP